jgi:hypothetical protein
MKRLLPIFSFLAAASVLAAPAPKHKGFFPIDLQKQGNKEVASNFAGGSEQNVLKDFPTGEKKFGDVTFNVGKKLITLGSTVAKDDPAKVEGIPVGQLASRLHFLHANGYGGGPNPEGAAWHVKDGTAIGSYTVHFEDKSKVDVPIVYGENTRDWFFIEGEKEPSKAKVVWTGENEFSVTVRSKLRVYLMSWDNPKPDKKIVSIDFSSKKEETVAAPFCIGITAEVK